MITLEQVASFKRLGDRVQDAVSFAEAAHEGQKRKYGDPPEDYVHHPIRVAELIHFQWHIRHRPDLVIVALLHDVLEDTEITVGAIIEAFDEDIAARVVQCTEVRYEGMNRRRRKEFYRSQIAASCDDVKLVKLADVWDNLSDFSTMVENDPGFAEQYLHEQRRLVLNIQPNALAFGPTMSVLNLIECNKDLYL